MENMFRFRRPRNEDNEDPSSKSGDEINMQKIIIPSDSIPSLGHAQTPGEATPVALSLRNDVRLMSGFNLGELKEILTKGLYGYARRDEWSQARPIYDQFPDMVSILLTASGDTALHVAVRANSTTYAKNLVERMTPRDLEIKNADENTAFCMAAIAGNGNILQNMIQKNENLALIAGHDGMLPVHLAALAGHHNIVQDLSSWSLLKRSDFKDIERLFFMTISSNMYDVATELLQNYPNMLAIARDDQNLTALHVLLRKHSEEFDMQENGNKEASSRWGHPLDLLKILWNEVRQLESDEIWELITKQSAVLFDAVKLGNIEAVRWILYMDRELLMMKDPNNGTSLVHYAVLHRQRSIFNFLLKMETGDLIIQEVDNDGNNVLHVAAHQLESSLSPGIQMQRKLWWKSKETSHLVARQSEEASVSLISIIQMHKELEWFKDVEKRVPRELMTWKNKEGKTPADIIDAKLMKFSDEVKKEAKGIAKSGMIVATLIVNVAFAAALTVPSDKINAWLAAFILANAVSLFTSSISIISFLSVFTAKLTEGKFIISIYSSVIHGLFSLILSVTTMVIAFGVASFLIFDHRSKWVAYVVVAMALLTIRKFLWDQSFLVDYVLYFFWSDPNNLFGKVKRFFKLHLE